MLLLRTTCFKVLLGLLALSAVTIHAAGEGLGANTDDSATIPVVNSLLLAGGPKIEFQDQQLVDVTVNGGLETGEFSGGGWSSPLSSAFGIEDQEVYAGAHSGRLYSPGVRVLGSYRQAVNPGEVYTFSCAAASIDLRNSSTIFVSFLDGDGNYLLDDEGEKFTITVAALVGTRGWRTYTLPNVRIPTDMCTMEIGIDVSRGTAGGHVYFDDFKLLRNVGLAIDVVPTYESAGFTVQSISDSAECTLYYREVGTARWQAAYPPMFDGDEADALEFRGSIVHLQPDTEYQAYAYLREGRTVIAQGGVTFHTWSESPPIGQTFTLDQLGYSGSGKLDLTGISGTQDAWVKIVGSGSDDVDAGYAEDEAIHLYNNQYVILENIQVKGGRRYGIHLERCLGVRVINCTISGWARIPAYVRDGISYENEAAYNAIPKVPINMDGGIFLDNSGQVTVERCYLHDPRLSANSWGFGHPCGPEGMVVKNDSTSGNHVVRYNDLIGSDDLRWNDGIEGYDNGSINGSFARDSDIYGNMIAYGQDDVIELDGGQENVRFFGNKGQDFFCGISVAPNKQGPSYIFRNAILDLGDSRDEKGAAVKQGGGYSYTHGFTYLFNNTFHVWGYGGIAGVGFGSYPATEPHERTRFYAVSRNNIVYNRDTPKETYTVTAISDHLKLTGNSFDYDNLTTGTLATAAVEYSDGQETHGILDTPPTFVDMDGAEYHDDIRPDVSSSAVDAGVVLTNFVETFTGGGPDQGALERGDSSLLPIRPIAISADRYRSFLEATAGGASSVATVTLTSGELGGDVHYSVLKNDTTDWLTVSPGEGTLGSDSSVDLTFSVNTASVTAGIPRKAVVLVRLDNGYSVPLTIEARMD